MIRSFKHRALAALWNKNDASRIHRDLAKLVSGRLNALDDATRPEMLSLPGFDFHRLRGKPLRYTVHVRGPWCLTFEWEGEDAVRVDLEQYH